MDYFYKLPTDYEIDFKSEMVKFCLWEKINLGGTTTVSLNYIRQRCGYSSDNRNKKSFSSYIRYILKALIDEKQILQVYGDDIESVSGTSYLEFKILDRFYNISSNAFAKLTSSAFDLIMSIDCGLTKATILKVYTYMRSRMIENAQQAYGFSSGLDNTIVKDLGLNRKTVDTCLTEFVDVGLFIKYTTGSYYLNGNPKNAPNIYVLPDKSADSNIKALLEGLKYRYKVDEFAPTLVPNIKAKTKNL